MTKTTLTKEYLESLIAQHFTGSNNFEWNAHDVTFTFDYKDDSQYDKKKLIEQINFQTNELLYHKGALNQANMTLSMMINGGDIIMEEEDGEEDPSGIR